MSNLTFDAVDILVRLAKYVFEGLVVALAAYFIPNRKSSAEEILLIALVAAATFAIMDLIPGLSSSVRAGAALGVGLNLVGTNIAGGGGPKF